LQARLNDAYSSTSVNDAIKSHSNIETINIENCPNLKFNFQALYRRNAQSAITAEDLPYEDKDGNLNQLGAYVKNYGLFSMFKSLTKLRLINSCLYNEKNNKFGVCEDSTFIISIPLVKTENAWVTPTKLRGLTLQNMPVKTFRLNATDGTIVFPGMRLSPDYDKDISIKDRLILSD
jgi:hypothetical protein